MGIGSDQWKLITSYQIFIIENHFSITNWLQLRKISFSWSFSRWRAEETFENNQSKIVVFCSTIWLSFSLWKSGEARFNYSETHFLIQSNFNTLPISIPLTEKSLKRVLPGCCCCWLPWVSEKVWCYLSDRGKKVCWIERKSELRELSSINAQHRKLPKNKREKKSIWYRKCLHTVQVLRQKNQSLLSFHLSHSLLMPKSRDCTSISPL